METKYEKIESYDEYDEEFEEAAMGPKRDDNHRDIVEREIIGNALFELKDLEFDRRMGRLFEKMASDLMAMIFSMPLADLSYDADADPDPEPYMSFREFETESCNEIRDMGFYFVGQTWRTICRSIASFIREEDEASSRAFVEEFNQIVQESAKEKFIKKKAELLETANTPAVTITDSPDDIEVENWSYLGYVYAVECDNLIKIGSTYRLKERVKEVQRFLSNYGEKSTGRVAYSAPILGYQKAERLFHRLYEDRRIGTGEMFNVTIDEFVEDAHSVIDQFRTRT